MRAIGVDLGTKRIGVAVELRHAGHPLRGGPRSGDRARDHRRIGELVAEAEAEVVVVGLPLSLDGSIGPAARRALDEVDAAADGRSTSRSRPGTNGSPP